MARVSINEYIMELDGQKPVLKGVKCKDCGNHVFQVQNGCPKCAGADMEPVSLGNRGTLWAWTIQGFPPKAPPYLGETDPSKFKPYGVGYVELPGEVKVEARLTESDPAMLKTGMEMELVLDPLTIDEDGNEVVTFAFSPINN